MTFLNKKHIRQLHSKFAPFMVLPLLLTLITGSLFQIAVLTDNVGDFYWLLEWHTGKFGPVDLQLIYPFLNAFGLLMLVITGITMWLQTQKRSPSN